MGKYYQVYNPKTKKWVKIDRTTRKIVDVKSSKGPYQTIRKGYRSPGKKRPKQKKSIWDRIF